MWYWLWWNPVSFSYDCRESRTYDWTTDKEAKPPKKQSPQPSSCTHSFLLHVNSVSMYTFIPSPCKFFLHVHRLTIATLTNKWLNRLPSLKQKQVPKKSLNIYECRNTRQQKKQIQNTDTTPNSKKVKGAAQRFLRRNGAAEFLKLQLLRPAIRMNSSYPNDWSAMLNPRKIQRQL